MSLYVTDESYYSWVASMAVQYDCAVVVLPGRLGYSIVLMPRSLAYGSAKVHTV